jgi:hypothetical protein
VLTCQPGTADKKNITHTKNIRVGMKSTEFDILYPKCHSGGVEHSVGGAGGLAIIREFWLLACLSFRIRVSRDQRISGSELSPLPFFYILPSLFLRALLGFSLPFSCILFLNRHFSV